MKAVYLMFLFVFMQLTVFGQETEKHKIFVEGRVFSGISKKPLGNVVTYLKREMAFSVTNSAGYFKIPVKASGENRLIVREFGYNQVDSLVEINNESLTNMTITLEADCSYNRTTAEEDILKGNPKLLLVGSIAPVIYKGQQKFERKFKVQYVDFGCTPPAEACIEEYNQKVFEYLDKKYGVKWRKEVRKDVRFLSKTK